MMLVNLTSPAMKNELKLKMIFVLIRAFIITLISLLIIMGLSIFIGTKLLNKKANDLVLEAERTKLLTQSQGQTSITDRIKGVNLQIMALQALQKRFVAWSPIISGFAALTPKNIKINSIAIDQKNATLAFSGKAATRDAYINYEKILQQSDLVTNVIFPLQTKKTDLSFSISVNIKNLPKP